MKTIVIFVFFLDTPLYFFPIVPIRLDEAGCNQIR